MSRKSSASTPKAFKVGTQTVAYSLIRTHRKTIGITIRPDMSVEVRAPHNLHDEAIEDVLQKRARWIMRHLANFAQRPAKSAPSTKPHEGSYLFLGQYLALRVARVDDNASDKERVLHKERVMHKEGVTLEEDTLTVWLKGTTDESRVVAQLAKWSRAQAEAYFSQRMTLLLEQFTSVTLRPAALKLRQMRARWGSCSTNGTITLNVKLIHLNPVLIDYVIMHELCHLIEHNHSKRYYALLAQMMPDWEARRQQLNETGMPE